MSFARFMAEIARGYPAGELIVSTGRLEGSERSDPGFPGPIDRIALPSSRLKTLQVTGDPDHIRRTIDERCPAPVSAPPGRAP